jgi:hypothetical protein
MFRLLFAFVCSLSLLLCTAATAVTVHSHRAWHRVVWQAAVGEGVRTSLAAIWRECREGGRANGPRSGGPGGVEALFPALTAVPARPQEYRSLSLAQGKVEFHRYPVPGPFC